MKDDIFLINEEGLLELNKPELRGISEFTSILARDKGGVVKGDYDGRKKYFAFKEFMYIYLYYRPTSIYKDLPDEAKHLRCIEDAKLPDDWKVDKLIKAAGKKYKELYSLSALYHSYSNSSKALYALGEDIKFFNTLRDKIRTKIKESTQLLEESIDEEDIQKSEIEIDRLTERLMNIGNKILALTEKLPSAFDTLDKLKKKIMDEASGGAAITGGGELGNREKG